MNSTQKVAQRAALPRPGPCAVASHNHDKPARCLSDSVPIYLSSHVGVSIQCGMPRVSGSVISVKTDDAAVSD